MSVPTGPAGASALGKRRRGSPRAAPGPVLRVVSSGAGVQSTTAALMGGERWRAMRERYAGTPAWAGVVRVDAAIRDARPDRRACLHRSGRPVDEAAVRRDGSPDEFLNDCEGRCGV